MFSAVHQDFCQFNTHLEVVNCPLLHLFRDQNNQWQLGAIVSEGMGEHQRTYSCVSSRPICPINPYPTWQVLIIRQ